MNPTPGSVFYEPPLAALPQLSEKPRQGFETKKTAWKPGPNVCNSTAAIGMRAGLVLEGVRKTYRARYYNPTTGRFLSEDPLGIMGSGTNLYAYANNNPINLNDPLGLCSAAAHNPFGPGFCSELQFAAAMLLMVVAILGLLALFFPAAALFVILSLGLQALATSLWIGGALAAILAGTGILGKSLGLCN